MLHLPVLRHGKVYRSLDVAPVPDVTGVASAEVGLANAGLLRRDLRRLDGARGALREVGVTGLVEACVAAADVFERGTLPVGDDAHGAEAYAAACSASTGLPRALVRANVAKIARVLREMPALLRGLTRGLDLSVLDAGVGEQDGIPLSFVPTARALAAVLPSNSPGVHSLWIPALPLLTPVVLKPGSADPWTPLRVVEALCAAGVPRQAFGFYPAARSVGAELVELHERAVVFGGPEVARRYGGRAGVQVHGPGFAKIVVGPDVRWEDHLDLLVDSVARNGGRSCINASTIVVPHGADALAAALAERLAALEPRPLDDPDATLAAIDPAVGRAISDVIDAALPGARDVSAEVTGLERVRSAHGLAFLRPTVVRAPPGHPLARTEHGFPFVAVVERPVDGVVDWLGPSLVVTALTSDPALRRALVDAPHVDRLHLGPVATTAIRWDQPHEGDLFGWLWRRRAVAW